MSAPRRQLLSTHLGKRDDAAADDNDDIDNDVAADGDDDGIDNDDEYDENNEDDG